MELVSDVGRVESCFSPFGDNVSVSPRLEHGLHRTYHRHRNHFWTNSIRLVGDEARLEARFGPFGDSASLDARLVLGLHQM
jgi:hypothetical protein